MFDSDKICLMAACSRVLSYHYSCSIYRPHMSIIQEFLPYYIHVYVGRGGGDMSLFENENLAIFAGNSQKDSLINYSKVAQKCSLFRTMT